MRPVSSASGMNSSGGMRPRPGWFQRTRASTETVWPVARSTIGWYWTTSSRCSIARSSSALRSRRRTIESRIAGVKTAWRRRPPSLASYMATSASRSSSSACVRACRFVAMPMLRLTLSSSSPAVTGRTKRLQRALGEVDGAALDVGRAADEDGEVVAAEARDDVRVLDAAHEPGGDAAQQLVADRVAERVVDALEVVEVDEHHGHLARGARLERLAHLLAEQRAVGEAGERVVAGLVLKLVLQVVQLGHGLLEAVVLQRGAGVGGQRLEQGAVAGS